MRSAHFGVLRNSLPIETVSITDSVATGIEFENPTFPIWDAAIAAGASLEELAQIDEGEFPVKFQAKLIAWHQLEQLIGMHREDAVARAMKRKKPKGVGSHRR